MADLKAIGSEKLTGDAKIRRIMEIARYGESSQNKELHTHNKFLVERLDRWAERNFQLRTELMNSPMAEKINKLNDMIKEANEVRP